MGQHQVGLVLNRPHRHEPPPRPPRRLANRRRIDRIVLVAPDIRLHMPRRDQPRLEAERQQLPPPMMRRGAGLHRHHALRQFRVKRDEPAARELARHHDLAVRVDGVNLEDLLRQIEPNARDRGQILNRLAHGRLPVRRGFDNDHLGTLMPFGRPVHPIIPGLLWYSGQRLRKRDIPGARCPRDNIAAGRDVTPFSRGMPDAIGEGQLGGRFCSPATPRPSRKGGQ